MADVIGTISGPEGVKDIQLNNAATEATLRALLQATLNASKQTKETVAAMAEKAGIDPAAVESVNAANTRQVGILQKVGAAYGGASVAVENVAKQFTTLESVVKQITIGTGDASGALTSIGNLLPGVLGSVTRGFANLINYQETLLKSYQDLSKVGATFGGSLTDMRLAASNTYMTLDQFSNVVKNNSEALSKLGGSVESGVKSFVNASKALLSSDTGDKLRALGYTTEEVNNGMLTYIAMTGGRTKEEMKNTDALKKSTEEYLLELDELARLTGKSKEEAQAKAKQAMLDANFQLFLSTKSKAEREVIEANVKRAAVLYGKGGEDIAKANAMGVAVQGEAGRKLTALSTGTADAIKRDLELRRQYGSRSKEVQDNEIEGRKRNAESLSRFAGPVGSYTDALKGNEDAVKQAATDRIQGEDGIRQQYQDIANERTKTEQSQARQAVETQAAMQKLAQQILDNVVPVISALWSVINPLVQSFANVVSALLKVPGLFETLGVVVAAVTALYVAQKAAMAVKAVSGVAGAAREAVASRGVLGAAGDFIMGRGGSTPPTVPPRPPVGPGPSPLSGLPGGGGVMSTAASGVQTLGGAIKGIGTGLGGAIKGILVGLAKGLQALANPKVLMGVGVLAALGGSLFIAGKAFQAFSNIDWANVTIGTVAIAALAVGAAALSTIAPMVLIGSAAIAALGASIWLVAKGLSAFPTGAIDGMLKPFNALGEITGNVFGAIGDLISGLLNTVKETFGFIWDVISWPFKQIGKLVSSVFDSASKIVDGFLDGVKATFGFIWDVVSWPFKQIGSIVSSAFDGISTLVSGLFDGIKATFGFIWDVVSWPFKQIGSIVSSAFNLVSNGVSGLFAGIKATFGFIWDVISWPFKQIGNIVSTVFDTLGNIASKYLEFMKSAYTTLWNIISWPYKQIAKIVSSAFEGISNLMSGFLDGVKATFGFIWDVISWPFKQIGSIVSSAVDGVSSLVSNLFNGIKATFGFIWDTISWPFKQIGSIVSSAVDGVSGIFSRLLDSVTSIFGSVWEVIKKPFSAIKDFVSAPFEAISNVFNNFKTTIGNVFNWVWEKITSVTNLIKSVGSFVGKIFGFNSDDKDKSKKDSDSKDNPTFTTATATLLSAANILKGVAETLKAIFPPELAAELKNKDSKKAVPIVVKLNEALKSTIAQPTAGAPNPNTITAKENLKSDNTGKMDDTTALQKAALKTPMTALGEFFSPTKAFNSTDGLINKVGLTKNNQSTANSLPDIAAPDQIGENKVNESIPEVKMGEIKGQASNLESLYNGITKLNKTMEEMLSYMKETADYTRRGADATRSLSGDMFRL